MSSPQILHLGMAALAVIAAVASAFVLPRFWNAVVGATRAFASRIRRHVTGVSDAATRMPAACVRLSSSLRADMARAAAHAAGTHVKLAARYHALLKAMRDEALLPMLHEVVAANQARDQMGIRRMDPSPQWLRDEAKASVPRKLADRRAAATGAFRTFLLGLGERDLSLLADGLAADEKRPRAASPSALIAFFRDEQALVSAKPEFAESHHHRYHFCFSDDPFWPVKIKAEPAPRRHVDHRSLDVAPA